ncbi:phenylalanine--tRNA ligase subunit alpha [Buchnera aphidicola (Ceratovacuna keduensis)]|uniref:phenylalanine--tRNA ligase subunit alpha n=1 Tax=Buchnera aphidicola TaxID=9 RepID=UPI0031B8901E
MNINKIHIFLKLVIIIIKNINSFYELKKIKKRILGKSSYLYINIKKIKFLKKDKKIIFGKLINRSINIIKKNIFLKEKYIKNKFIKKNKKKIFFDVSLQGKKSLKGSIHPISSSISKIENFFYNIGFNIITGYEIEDKYHNFTALNIPKHHPSRNLQDTFWINKNILLRTQTSNVQIHIMKNKNLPIKIISIGKVYRNDNDIKHTPMFHQIEGLIINKKINFSNLKWIIKNFLKNFFNSDISIRFRSSYFPFTVPSAEVDIKEKNGKWLEILGCGMVHPNVLKNMKIDYKKYIGCAFGIGIERLTMLKYGILDLRYFFENNLSFLNKFK